MRTAIIGLDSVPPELLFEKLLDKLPNFKKIYQQGMHGKLRTCDPPITVPAWMVMMTGKNPGELDIYGFKHRRGYSYNDGYIVNSSNVHDRTIWEVLSARGRRSVVLGGPSRLSAEARLERPDGLLLLDALLRKTVHVP